MKKLLFIASVGLLFSCNAPDCTNGEQDGNETGIDCGGDCPPCQNNNTNNTNNAYLNPNLTYGNVTDIDGNEYATIQIGTQIWMAENLKTTKYCNGDPIPNITDSLQWFNLTTGAWVHYDNDSQYENLYGKLYNWAAVDDSRNICPCNWHVPTHEEWTMLTDYLGGEFNAGPKIKSTNGWDNTDGFNMLGTNLSGFSALPGRQRYGASFHHSEFGYWWSSTEYDTYNAWERILGGIDGVINIYNANKDAGNSVRCIKD